MKSESHLIRSLSLAVLTPVGSARALLVVLARLS